MGIFGRRKPPGVLLGLPVPTTTISDDAPRRRLDRALDRVEVTFRGMTAHADEAQCTCHWGSEEELALLKVPDVELDPDLLHRTWSATDWTDPGAVTRRVLPQLARALVAGQVEPLLDMSDVGGSLARAGWRLWPARQTVVVWEFLHAWWAATLVDPDPAVPAHEVFALCVEASVSLGPWLTVWEAVDHPAADRHLAEAAASWEYDLLGDQLPWHASEDARALRAGLADWLARHAPARLRAHGADAELLHRIRLVGLSGPARWEDPHWPGHRY